MTDCPERLTTGVGLMVTLRIYLRATAFKPLRSSNTSDDSIQFGFQEGLQTEEERSMFCMVKFPALSNPLTNSVPYESGRKPL
jgi:hypothetical protein